MHITITLDEEETKRALADEDLRSTIECALPDELSFRATEIFGEPVPFMVDVIWDRATEDDYDADDVLRSLDERAG